MTAAEAEREIFRIIVQSTETELAVTEETKLFEEMGLSSMEVFILLGDLEEAFGIDIPAAGLRSVRTAGDLSKYVLELLK